MNVERWATNVLILVVIVAVAVYAHAQATQAEDALCALRQNFEERIAASEEYLADVKAGRRKPIAGITNADIKRGIDNQRQTVVALSGLRCPAPE